MGAPAPPPILAAVDEVLAFALGELWAQTSAREQAALRDSLWLLQQWVTVRWPPFPAVLEEGGDGCRRES
jgi:hypothetical protein